jgi:predicted NUDIX family NTP pyrophosphohydrolase
LYRRVGQAIQIFLAHPGGPFWKNKDDGAWTFPKGEHDAGEDALTAARREFHEETGVAVDGTFIDLGSIKQRGGKIVQIWAVEGDADPSAIRSNMCTIEWPPKSGHRLEIPEVDRAGWFSPDEAKRKLLGAQVPFVDRLLERVAVRP